MADTQELSEEDEYSLIAKQIVDESIERAAKQLADKKVKTDKKACSQTDLQTYLRRHHDRVRVSLVPEVGYEVGMGGVEGQEGGDDSSSENIRWPTCEVFTVELGEEKIRQLIKTWQYSEGWLFHITLLAVDELEYNTRYRYRVMWSIPTRRLPIPRATASIYFTIDVSKVKPPSYTQVQAYYVFESSRLVHRPGQTTFREEWLRNIINNKVALLELIDF